MSRQTANAGERKESSAEKSANKDMNELLESVIAFIDCVNGYSPLGLEVFHY